MTSLRLYRAFAASLALAAPAAFAAGCEPLLAAATKLATTPNRQVSVYQRGTLRVPAMEAVTIGGAKWSRDDPASPWVKEANDSARGVKELQGAACRFLRDDGGAGEPAAVYEVRHLNGDASDDEPTQMWISKASGLPLRLVVGDAKASATTSFDYRDVKAPSR